MPTTPVKSPSAGAIATGKVRLELFRVFHGRSAASAREHDCQPKESFISAYSLIRDTTCVHCYALKIRIRRRPTRNSRRQ